MATKPVWDDLVKGLHLRTSEKGRGAYYLYYRTSAGIQRRPKLGSADVMTLAQARRLARSWLVKVAAGEDPSLERQDIRSEMTVAALYALCAREHWGKEKFQKSGHAHEVEKLWCKHLVGNFGHLKLSQVTAPAVGEWHAALESTPFTANRALAALSKCFRFAEKKGFRQPGTNPCSAVDRHPEQARSRFATAEEMAKIGPLLEREAATDPHGVAFLRVLIFTGARPRSIERAMRSQLVGNTLTFEGKTGVEQVVLPLQALMAVESLGLRQDGLLIGCKMPRALWERIRAEAGCPDLWARDWRRTFSTVGMTAGHDPAKMGELLNHKDAQTDKIYGKLMDGERQKVASATAATIEEMLKGKGAA